jgi:glyoxylase-like metal-dependent hydrolase (beta-lactamase superfamily II)
MNQTSGCKVSFFEIRRSRDYEAPHLGNIPIDECFRVLLLQTLNFKVLFDVGPGGYFLEEGTQRAVFEKGKPSFLSAMSDNGLSPKDITHIIFSHLHYNRAGGLIMINEGRSTQKQKPVFTNAKIYVSQASYERARKPHLMDKNIFIPHICDVIDNCTDISFISHGEVLELDDARIEFHETHGHSPGMIVSEIHCDNKCIINGTDLLPNKQCIDLKVFTGVDRFAEKVIDEKIALIERAIAEDAWFFYSNDVNYAYSKVVFDQNTKKYESNEHTNSLSD